jgi:hypothetical protein
LIEDATVVVVGVCATGRELKPSSGLVVAGLVEIEPDKSKMSRSMLESSVPPTAR